MRLFMYSEILYIKARLDELEAKNMEKKLNGRFSNVAKKFGSGLKKAIIGGGILALGAAVIGKLLNPLKDAQETMDRILSKGDDLVTNAAQFDTTEGNLFKLQSLAQSTGLEPEILRMMLAKFQGELAQARVDEKDPTKKESDKSSPVRAFIGEKDTAEAFFKFIQSLQHVNKDTQVLAQNQVFGEKVSGKASEFLNLDFSKQLKDLHLPDTDKLTEAAKKLGSLNDLKDLLETSRDAEDFIKKANLLREKMVRNQDQSEKLKLDKENVDIKALDAFKPTSIAIQELTNKFDAAFLRIETTWAPIILDAVVKTADISDRILKWLAAWTVRWDKFSWSDLVRGTPKQQGPKY